jgi:hypothetical protein
MKDEFRDHPQNKVRSRSFDVPDRIQDIKTDFRSPDLFPLQLPAKKSLRNSCEETSISILFLTRYVSYGRLLIPSKNHQQSKTWPLLQKILPSEFVITTFFCSFFNTDVHRFWLCVTFGESEDKNESHFSNSTEMRKERNF